VPTVLRAGVLAALLVATCAGGASAKECADLEAALESAQAESTAKQAGAEAALSFPNFDTAQADVLFEEARRAAASADHLRRRLAEGKCD
jgi:hypothetical protein